MIGWRIYAYGMAIVALLSAFWVVNHWRLRSAELDVRTAELASCESGKHITEDANVKLQKDRDATSRKLADLKRVYADKRVFVSSTTNPVGTGARATGQDGVSAESLFEFTSEHCSRYRNERIALEKFIADERK